MLLACAETLHGIARTVLVVPRIGKDRAIKLSALTGSILAFVICYVFVPAIGLQGPAQHLALGVLLAAFMALFDIGMGLVLMRKSWRKVMTDCIDPVKSCSGVNVEGNDDEHHDGRRHQALDSQT